MKAIVLAAGYATRLGEIAKNVPKALISVAGKPMIGHLIDRIDKAGGIEEIVVVSNASFFVQLDDWARSLNRRDIVVINDGSTCPQDALGALGDFRFALTHTGLTDVFLSVGDNYFTFGLEGFFNRYRQLAKPVLLARAIDDIEVLRRVAVAELDADGRVLRLIEKPKEPIGNVAMFGLYLYPEYAVAMLDSYFASGGIKDQPGHFPVWLHDKTEVYAYAAPDDIFDVGTPESLAHVRALYGN